MTEQDIGKQAAELYDSGDKQKAVELLAKTLQKDFKQLPLLLQLSTYLTYGGDFDQAAELLLRSKQHFSDEKIIDYNLGNVYYSAGQYEEAASIFEKLIKENYGSDALYMMAQVKIKQNDLPHAFGYALTASDEEKSADSYELVGDIALQMAEYKLAEEFFGKSVNAEKSGKNLFKLALAQMVNEKEEYKETFIEAKKLDSKYYEEHMQQLDDIQKSIKEAENKEDDNNK